MGRYLLSQTVYSAGDYGNTVSIVRRVPGGNYYIRMRDPNKASGYLVRSLGHDNLDKAKSRADSLAGRLRNRKKRLREEQLLLWEVFDYYLVERTPQHGAEAVRARDRRRAEMWKSYLGPKKNPMMITRQEWEEFRDRRLAGALDARGREVPEGERTSRAPSTVRHELHWLRSVLRWASTWETDSGDSLIRECPVEGYPMPEVKNQKRPVASRERYEALREAAVGHKMRLCRDGSYSYQRSYFIDILDLVVHTGRRITQVCSLRVEDLFLDSFSHAPHGYIDWPRERDKMGKEWRAPLNDEARGAVDRALENCPEPDSPFLFPAPESPERPIRRQTAGSWLEKFEQEAELEPQEAGQWHPFRRMWASERMHLPQEIVARTGGWASASVMRQSYQHADDSAKFGVVSDVRERRVRG